MTRQETYTTFPMAIDALVSSHRMNRRQVLRLFAASSVATVGGAVLSACGGDGETNQSVTLEAPESGWPMDAIPTKEVQEKYPFKKGYADWLADWLKKNPGVSIKTNSTNIWDQKTLSTAVGAGTAPSWFLATVLGNHTEAGTRAAFARRQAADTTELFKAYRSKMNIADYAQQAWEASWSVNGRYYGAPGDYFPGRGIYYRRDWLKEAGIEEPKVGTDWTWEKVREMAKALMTDKRKGIIFQKSGLGIVLSSYQFDMLTMLPDNTGTNWHWKYDYTSQLNEWMKPINLYRDMVFKDKSVLHDVAYGEGEAEQAFFREDAAMVEMHSSFLTHPADSDPASPLALANKLGKPLDEVVGYIIDPIGGNGAFGATQGSVGIVAMSPHLRKYPLEKAFDVFVSFWLIDGLTKANEASYKAQPTRENALALTQGITPTNPQGAKFPDLPGDSRTFWGDKVVDSMLEGANVPIIPNYARYTPLEQVAGPPPQAYDDAMSKLAFTANVDAEEIIKNMESVRNQQAISLPSNASQDDFNKGARTYYKALDEFWKKHAPTFHSKVYQPWYQKNVVPVIGK